MAQARRAALTVAFAPERSRIRFPGEKDSVLKITITETETETRWILQGGLVGPWVRELRSCWKKRHRTQTERVCVVDLNDVTFIDESGERLLRAILKNGAQVVAKGIYTKHLLDMLKSKGKHG